MNRFLLLCVAASACLALVANTGAASIRYAPGSPQGQHATWIRVARVPVAKHVVLHRQGCPAQPQFTCHQGEAIFMLPSQWNDRTAFMHEMGHLYADTRPGLAWPDDERWADMYAHCAINGVGPASSRTVFIGGYYLKAMSGNAYRRACLAVKSS